MSPACSKAEGKGRIVLTLAAIGAIAGVAIAQPEGAPPRDRGAERFACTVAATRRGDTLLCRERSRRVRLAGIAARPQAATALDRLARGRAMMCRPLLGLPGGYGWCRRADGLDLGCALVARGAARPLPPAWQPARCARPRGAGRIMD